MHVLPNAQRERSELLKSKSELLEVWGKDVVSPARGAGEPGSSAGASVQNTNSSNSVRTRVGSSLGHGTSSKQGNLASV